MPHFHVHDHEGFLRFRPAGEAALPTVVHVPGFGEDAASAAPFALRLAVAGFQCLALNPPWESTPELHSPSPALLFELLEQANVQLARLLDALRDDSDLQAGWLALTGFSMGGLLVSRTLAQAAPHPFRAAAMVLATGDWSFLPRTTLAAFPELAAAMPPDALALAEQLLRAQSPIATPERFAPTPLLLLNADHDPRVPLPAAARFHEALRPAYQAVDAGDALQFHVHRGDRHEFRRAMQRQVRSWLLERWRAAQGASS